MNEETRELIIRTTIQAFKDARRLETATPYDIAAYLLWNEDFSEIRVSEVKDLLPAIWLQRNQELGIRT